MSEDEPALLALDTATWSPDVSPAPEPGRKGPFFKQGDRPEDVLVAEVGGRAVGYIQLHPPTKLASNAPSSRSAASRSIRASRAVASAVR